MLIGLVKENKLAGCGLNVSATPKADKRMTDISHFALPRPLSRALRTCKYMYIRYEHSFLRAAATKPFL